MNKLKMESVDMTEKNIERIAEMFPQVVTEVADPTGAKDAQGKPLLKKAIDFEKLKLVLSAGSGDYVVVDDERERYEFTWVGKRQAMIDAATPIRKTLRPCPEESKDWATTENLYIEGDNLDVIKLLQESYLGKVKMIYIDPPYNTGKDFIYKDIFSIPKDEEEEAIGMYDDDDNRLFSNPKTNGRFHSDWCSMIYPRLQLARNLLTDDGVIFISIDDNEVRNLKNICDEVFGKDNSLGIISIINNLKGRSDDKFFATCNEFLLVYAKNSDEFVIGGFELEDEELDNDYDKQDEISFYKTIGFRKTGANWERIYRPFMFYPVLYKNNMFSIVSINELEEIYNKNTDIFNDEFLTGLIAKYEQEGYKVILPTNENGEYGRWRWGVETFIREKDINLTFNSADTLCTKMRATLEDGSIRIKSAKTLWYKPEYDTGSGAKILKNLFQNSSDVFSNPKSIVYIKDILKISTNSNDIILDFFSGSATTAHAVMQFNVENGGNRKFIMVQLPEVCNPNSEAAKAGYKNICEIGKERIRRAGDKIAIEQKAKNNGLFPDDVKQLDTGFRVLKLDTTNMKDVYYAAGELKQSELFDMVSNIKDDRSDIDLLYGCLLDWGVPLSMPHTSEKIDGSTVHTVDAPQTDGIDLIACFDQEVDETTVRAIATRKPMRAVFRDWSFRDSADKINVTEIFKALSPDTTVKVI